MKQYKILFILLFFLFLPFVVKAESCDSSSVKIESIELTDTKGNAEEISEAIVTGNKINFNIVLHELDDSLEYNLKIKNESKDDFYFDDEFLNLETDYIKYEIVSDDSNVVKAGKEKTLKLRFEYKNEVPEELLAGNVFDDTNNMVIRMSNKNLIEVPNTFKSSNLYIIFCLLIGLVILGLLIIFRGKKSTKYMTLIILVSFFALNTVYALCNYSIELEVDVKIEKLSNVVSYDLYGEVLGLKLGDSVDLEIAESNIYNQHLFEQANGTLYSINNQILSTDYNDMINIFYVNYPVFFGFHIEDNVITRISLMYPINNNVYTLKLGDYNSYESNRQILNDSFGESNCVFCDDQSCYCSLNNYIGYISKESGEVFVHISNSGCGINGNAVTDCGLD